MKVIQIIPMFGMGGAEIMCETLSYQLKKQGIGVIVVSLYDFKSAITERMEQAGIDIRYMKKKSGFDLSMIWKLRELFKKEAPDVIHTHLSSALYAVPASVGLVVKRIHTVHNIAEKELIKPVRWAYKFFYKHMGLIPVALSEQVKISIIEEYELEDTVVPVVYNGVDLSKCKEKVEYSIGERMKILHIGRFAEAKNHEGLLRAFRIFNEMYPESELWLVGDGALRSQIEAYVEENKLNKNVTFWGIQQEVYELLCSADVFCLPSIYEGMPMTIIEAMATGIPIVATRVGGIPDMVGDSESALLINVDVKELVDSLIMLINNAEKRAELGKQAKMQSKRFSAEIMGADYASIYKR